MVGIPLDGSESFGLALKKMNRPLGGRGRFHSALAPGGKCFEQLFGLMPNRGRGRHSLGLVRAVPVAFLSCQFGEESS